MMTVTSYEVPEGAYGVAVAGDGAVWGTLPHADALVRLDPGGGWDLVPLEGGSRPTVMASGPDGDVWFSRSDGAIGRVELDRAVTTFALSGEASAYGICVAPDGSVWYTDPADDRIGCLRPDRRVDEFELPRGSVPSLITAGPDGAIRCTLNQLHAVAVVSGSSVEIVATPTPSAAPVGISGSVGGVWFTEIDAGQVGRAGGDGAIVEHALPDRSCRPHAVAATDDGGCWVTLWASASVVRLDDGGRVVAEVGFAEEAEPHGIALAAGGEVWVALETGALARIDDAP
jgi:virginiamycin B lyase